VASIDRSLAIMHSQAAIRTSGRDPHGVGKRGAHDHTSGRPVTNFFRNNRLYAANTSLDRDRDGIACEKA
jgi:hypothetical protein